MIHLPLLVSRKIRFYMMFPTVPREDIKVGKYYENNQSSIEAWKTEFRGFCEMIYGWRVSDLNIIYKIMSLHKVLNVTRDDLHTIRKYLLNGYDGVDDDDVFDEVYNSGLLSRIETGNLNSKYGLYVYEWDQHISNDGMYFGINVGKRNVGRYGEPQYGSLNTYEVPLGSLLAEINVESKNLAEFTKLYGIGPELHVITKAY